MSCNGTFPTVTTADLCSLALTRGRVRCVVVLALCGGSILTSSRRHVVNVLPGREATEGRLGRPANQVRRGAVVTPLASVATHVRLCSRTILHSSLTSWCSVGPLPAPGTMIGTDYLVEEGPEDVSNTSWPHPSLTDAAIYGTPCDTCECISASVCWSSSMVSWRATCGTFRARSR